MSGLRTYKGAPRVYRYEFKTPQDAAIYLESQGFRRITPGNWMRGEATAEIVETPACAVFISGFIPTPPAHVR